MPSIIQSAKTDFTAFPIQLGNIGQSGPLAKGANMTKIEFSSESYTLAISGNEIKIELEKLASHKAVCEYIFRHGIKQMLGDAFSTHKGSDAEKLAKALKKLDSLYEGKAVQERVGGGDPVAREMRSMAEADVVKAIKAAGKKVKDFSKEALAKAIAAKLEKNADAYRKAAEKILAIKPVGVAEDDDILAMLED